MRFLLILLIPFFLFAETDIITYKPMTDLNMTSEGSLMRINKINNETFDFFKIYVTNETANKLSVKCKVKFKDDFLSLSTGKPFKCGETYLEFVNKEAPEEYRMTLSHTLDSFVNEFLLINIGKLICLTLIMITFILYMFEEKGFIIAIGFFLAFGIGGYVGYTKALTGFNKYPYQKRYLIKYYDNIEDKEGNKVFRKGFADEDTRKWKEAR